MEFKMPPQFTSVEEALFSVFGAGSKIKTVQKLAGGDINEACRLTLSNGKRVFIKLNNKKNASFFSAEAAGLAAIAGTKTVRTPEVFGFGSDEEKSGRSFLMLEFIGEQKPVSDYWETFACQLSAMHRADASSFVKDGTYGFVCGNYIGSETQINTGCCSWTAFFRDCRLKPQFKRAAAYFDQAERRQIVKLLDHLEDILVEPEQPSLLHGDLWSGNVIAGHDGNAWLIDPAVYVGHAEADLAMTELFGGFPQEFYHTYQEMGLQQEGYRRRKDLYNLYHLLNHLNMFGRSYLLSVKRIIREYVQ